MNAPIKVTDLVTKSLDSLTAAQNATDPAQVARHERNAEVYSRLATAQSAKTANILTYLNSDREKWSETDELVVRVMLGLHSADEPDNGDGGVDADVDDEPIEPEPTFGVESAEATVAEIDFDDAPSFMPDVEPAGAH